VTTQRSSIRQRKKHTANSRKKEEHTPVPILLLVHTKELLSQLTTTDTTQTICGMQIAQKPTGKKKLDKNNVKIFSSRKRRQPRKRTPKHAKH